MNQAAATFDRLPFKECSIAPDGVQYDGNLAGRGDRGAFPADSLGPGLLRVGLDNALVSDFAGPR
jgi:hypothetical protein